MLACVAAAPALVVVLSLSALLVALWVAAYGPCRKCGSGRREPGCVACRGSGDPRRPVFNDPLSRKRRGEK
jgi:hypothetical protein